MRSRPKPQECVEADRTLAAGAIDGDIAADAAEEIAAAVNVFGVTAGQCFDRSQEILLMQNLDSSGDVVRDIEAEIRFRDNALKVAVVRRFVIPSGDQTARPRAVGVGDRRRSPLNIAWFGDLRIVQMSSRKLRRP